jgi:hypothetical protein
MNQPSYPGPDRDSMDERADKAKDEPEVRPGRARPAQGDHTAAGGRPSHRGPDGGLGMGHRAPYGWPAGHQE